MADWFRSWHGAPTDPKWVLIARKASTTPAVASAIAWALFDCASQSSPRGSVASFDCEVYAAWAGIEDDVVFGVLRAMTERGMIVDGALSSWSKRQPEREDGSAERAKAWRERKKERENAKEEDANAGERNRTQRDAPDTDTEIDTEIESKSAQSVTPRGRCAPSSPPDPVAIQTRAAIASAYTGAGALPPDTSRVAVWLANGFTADEITSCITAVLARGTVPSSLKYFDKPLVEIRTAPRAPPHGQQGSPAPRRGSAAILDALNRISTQDFTHDAERGTARDTNRPAITGGALLGLPGPG